MGLRKLNTDEDGSEEMWKKNERSRYNEENFDSNFREATTPPKPPTTQDKVRAAVEKGMESAGVTAEKVVRSAKTYGKKAADKVYDSFVMSEEEVQLEKAKKASKKQAKAESLEEYADYADDGQLNKSTSGGNVVVNVNSGGAVSSAPGRPLPKTKLGKFREGIENIRSQLGGIGGDLQGITKAVGGNTNPLPAEMLGIGGGSMRDPLEGMNGGFGGGDPLGMLGWGSGVGSRQVRDPLGMLGAGTGSRGRRRMADPLSMLGGGVGGGRRRNADPLAMLTGGMGRGKSKRQSDVLSMLGGGLGGGSKGGKDPLSMLTDGMGFGQPQKRKKKRKTRRRY